MQPLVSIVVPIYQVEKYLDLCIQSLLCQTYSQIEFLLIDDGSPDRCPEMCDNYKEQDHRVRVIHKPNGGLSSARNAGIEVAMGEYITFVDADDILAPSAVEEMVRLALSEQADIVKISLARKMAGQPLVPTSGNHEIISGNEALSRIYTSKPQIISACGKLFKASLFRHIRFPLGRFYEDEYTTPKLFHLAERVVLSESVLYFYMQWDNNSIMRTALTEKKITDALFITRERIDFFRMINQKALVRKAIADHYIKLQKLENASCEVADLAKIHQCITAEKSAFAQSHPLISGWVNFRQFISHLKSALLGYMSKKS